MASFIPGRAACAVFGLPTSTDYQCRGCNCAIHWWESMDHDSSKCRGVKVRIIGVLVVGTAMFLLLLGVALL